MQPNYKGIGTDTRKKSLELKSKMMFLICWNVGHYCIWYSTVVESLKSMFPW